MTAKPKKIPFAINRDDSRSLLDQVTDGLREAIMCGYYVPGDVLPSSNELVPLLGVSRIVTQNALARITAEGLITSRVGVRSVVRDRGAKQWRGRVVFVCPEGDENYAQTVMAGVLRDRLTEAGYLFSQVCVPQTEPSHYDFARLDVALAQSVDIIVTMFARPAILARLARQKVPYAVFGEFEKLPPSAVGGTWLNFNLAMPDFAAACRAQGVEEVVELYNWSMMGDVKPALAQVGIPVRKVKVRLKGAGLSLLDVKRAGMEAVTNLIAEMSSGNSARVYFFADDYLASGALAALSYAGLKAPEDIQLATFANKRLGPIYPRELSRMEFDANHAGEVLSDAVLAYLKTGVYPSGSVVGPVWIAGETMNAVSGKSPHVNQGGKP